MWIQKVPTLLGACAGDQKHRSGPATAPHPDSCDTCTIILRAFAAPASESFTSQLGTSGDLLASSCPHRRLIRWASERWPDGIVIHINRDKDSAHAYLRYDIEGEHFYGTRCSQEFGLVALPEQNGHPGSVRVFDREWINEQTARNWLT